MKACKRIFSCSIPLVLFLFSITSHAQDTSIGKESKQPVHVGVLKNITISEDRNFTNIEITSDKPLAYTKYSITEPPRAVIDLPSTEIGSLEAPKVNNSKIVKSVELSKGNTDSGPRTRVIINLKKNEDFNVVQDQTNTCKLKISIADHEQNLNSALASNARSLEQKPVLFSQGQSSLGEKTAKNEIPSSKVSKPADKNEIIDTSDKSGAVAAKDGKKTISALNITGDGIEIIANSGISNYKSFRMSKPQRLILDIFGVTTSIKGKIVPVNRFGIGKARLGVYPEKIRIVFDATGKSFPDYKFENSDKGLNVVFTDLDKARKIAVPDKSVSAPEETLKTAAADKKEKLSIESIDFNVVDGYSRITIKANDTIEIAKPLRTAKKILLTAKNCLLPKKLQRPFNTSAFESSVISITPYQVRTRTGSDTKILIKLRSDAPYTLKPEGNIVLLDIKNEEIPESYPRVSGVQRTAKGPSPGRQPSSASREPAVNQMTPGKKVYTGARVTLEFADADIRKIFQLIAEVSNLNFLLGDDVTGTISIKLVNVPWDQALDVILETKGLGMKREGNIVMIRPISKIQTIADEQQAEKKASERAMELRTRVFDVNFASIGDIAIQFNNLKSERGIIAQDSRTNRIIVTDIEPAIEKMAFLLKALDIPEKQVMIEARIVEASSDFTRDLGVQWGIHYKDGSASILGINQLDSSLGGVVTNVAPAVGFPDPKISGGAVGVSFGKLTSNMQIDLRLSAAEVTGQAKIISTPKVVTLNNKAAKISQGQSIPYQTVSAEGTKTEFVEAALTLEVTPHITADGNILMKIKASNNSPGTPVQGSTAPPINKKEATTEMLVKNGETTVIGGIYVDNDQTTTSGVPFLKDIPLLGWLFKSNEKKAQKTELLIFITPKIVT